MEAKQESQCLLTKAENPVEGVCDGGANGPTEKTNVKSFWTDLTLFQKGIFIYVAIGTTTVFFCQAVPQPFLSRVVVRKGGERVYAAAIIHSTYFFGAIASLLCGKYQSKIPTKKFVWIGLLILAVTQGCFGFLQYIDDIYTFITIGFLVKSIQGVGQGFHNVATLTLLWHELPDYVGKSFGMIKVMNSLGFLMGPVLGGYLYSIQDEIVIPFMASAALPLVLSFTGWIILPDVENNQQEKYYRTWRYICNAKSMIALGLSATCGAVFAVYDASFTSYAQTMGINVFTVGVIASTAEFFTAAANTLAGYFLPFNRVCRKIFILIFFVGMFGINFLFTKKQSLPILYVGVSVFSVIASLVQTLAFPEMIYQSLGENGDLANDFTFCRKLSGVWYFVTTMAMFVFGVVGTGLQNFVPYSMSLMITTLVGVVITCAVFGFVTIYRYLKEDVAEVVSKSTSLEVE